MSTALKSPNDPIVEASLPLVVELLLVSQGVCTPAEWKCASGECIAEIERCDNVTHCADGSDEFGCGNYRSRVAGVKSVLATPGLLPLRDC